MRPPDKPRGRPGRTAPHTISTTAKQSDGLRVAQATDAAGELAAWGAAEEHLHAAGLPAAVPPFPAAWLRRRGVRPDWVAAA
jgi:hypothetical protein